MAATEALLAWWPPTLVPSGLGRTWLASWIMRIASHSTRPSMASRTASEGAWSGPRVAPVAAGFERSRAQGAVLCAICQVIEADEVTNDTIELDEMDARILAIL